MNMDFDQARANMVEQQVRPWDVLDAQVLQLFASIPREDFVPVRYRKMAFADLAIPLDNDQCMMKPVVEGRLLQALELQADETVLEIGTGSGYLTACLASLGRHVTSIDIVQEFTTTAGSKLTDQGITHATLETADVANGINTSEQYDAIAVTGSLPLLQKQFHESLKIGGRLFVITGKLPIMEALLITRIDDNNWSQESLFETCIPPLEHATRPQGSVF